MGKCRKQRFVDKNKSESYKLVHRSQRDPLIADADAPEHVLAPMGPSAGGAPEPAARRVEQVKCGIDFDDDYNYLQHLRDTGEAVHVAGGDEPVLERYTMRPDGTVDSAASSSSQAAPLPSSVFETPGVQLRVGLLNQAAPQPGPQPDLDAEILAALDAPERFADGTLEDDFVTVANTRSSHPDHSGTDESEHEEGDGSDDLGSDFDGDERNFVAEETRTRFTEYSMSSSVMPRSENLQTLDARFEKLYEQYDEEEMGELPLAMDEELVGHVEPDSQRVLQLVEQFEKKRDEKQELLHSALEGDDRAEKSVRIYSDESDVELEPHDAEPCEEKEKRWDCESILTTYSNIYNRPAVIAEESARKRRVKLDARGVPTSDSGAGLTRHKLKKLGLGEKRSADDMELDCASRASAASTVRPKDESSEQRRERKHVVKAMRRERRAEKKQNKLAFTDEMLRQRKQAVAQQKHVTVIQ